MSHFTVAVFTEENQTVEELLEPFYEGLEVEPYVSKTKEEVLKEIQEYCDKDEKLKKEYLKLSDKEKMNRWNGYDEFDEDGNPLSTYNPDSKWDWYVVGGRWSGLLKTKDGRRVDSCLLKDLDLSIDKNVYDQHIRFWELVVEEQPLKEGEEKPFNFYKKEYYLERYGTKEKYARIESQLSTYAILTPDGEWYEPGEMGWFGMSGASIEDEISWDENYQNILESMDKDLRITIVDCHI